MIDNFSLALTHGLMLFAAWRLLFRDDLDKETKVEPDQGQLGWSKDPRRDA